MTQQNLKSGTIWAAIQRFGGVALAFAVNLVLTRMLTPEDFGLMGVLLIFISISEILLDGGFTSALIRKKNPTPTDFTTYGIWAFGCSVFLYLLLYVCAPLIGRFFETPRLVSILRWWGLDLIFYSILSVQSCYLRKQMRFKALAFCFISAYIVAAAAGIYLAIKGFGVWSIVTMYLLNPLLCGVFLMIPMRGFKPGRFSREALAELFSFGGFMLGIDLMKRLSTNLQSVIIGKRFTIADTGLYTQAYKLNQVCDYHVPLVISTVLYPALSSVQDDRNKLNFLIDKTLRLVSLLIYPILGILLLYGDSIVDFLYGRHWHAAGEYFRIMTVGGFFTVLESTLFHAVATMGKSRALFGARCYLLILLIAALLVGAQFGITGLLWSIDIAALNSFVVHAYMTAKYTGYRISALIRAIYAPCLMTLGVMTLLILLNRLLPNVLLSIALYVLIYVALAQIFGFINLKAISKRG